ncbi:hypothetical protein NEUTE1DRAFT_87805 [Neurospora tetrasperma FGSC 2508]|uniref:Uncharacterized protein n=1 Tax=Neurospora tetrasperma (strain FGSC 2508 / ATCC MYA-4615 / P0657) TaxID=510951 RepID=F8MXI1_NEUT8|nr:uncharacterized protein NEUTE1DRAFT_87805 [Neurospora tetrasperma FGSC 2508]EGO54452.1 hypothetical protein NEUTE1DRAFT_87805 [Neurospora tetrasperma FGSC 2508]EGZ68098.1 hypothetical protein NEUTE2DRAFT_117630 [Neurospora tetrasperma FGSC 2509]
MMVYISLCEVDDIPGMIVVLKGSSHGSRLMAVKSRDGSLSGQSWGVGGKAQKGNIQVP